MPPTSPQPTCQYNHRSEVYSFATVLWEMCARKKPFGGLGEVAFKKGLLKGYREPINPKWPVLLRQIIDESWEVDEKLRPEFSSVVTRLEGVAQELGMPM